MVVGDPKMDVDEAARIMRTRKIKKLSVVKKGRLVGLITTTDMVRSPEVMKMMIRTIERNIPIANARAPNELSRDHLC